jgi:hypothetical protein
MYTFDFVCVFHHFGRQLSAPQRSGFGLWAHDSLRPAQVTTCLLPPTPLYHGANLQDHMVLFHWRSIKPNLSEEEIIQFILQDLVVDIAQLLKVRFVATDPC